MPIVRVLELLAHTRPSVFGSECDAIIIVQSPLFRALTTP